MLKLLGSLLVVLSWVCLGRLFRRRQKISELFAQGRKAPERAENLSITRVANFTGLFPASCFREVISLSVMEEAENQFMERSLLMRISSLSILDQGFCQWQMLVQTPMVHNSSSPL